ncbi:MAG: rRNA (guanine527-N7)-methyltransferase [Acidobacteriota bacterium]|jgi:16S rRNA (guanine527-N7)-methyltransferase|nr:rRNA (guanine527-N7)-methyltransferase [Acidobacteriota bacterium]
MTEHLSDADKFMGALKKFAPEFQVELSDDSILRLKEYYGLVMAWNARLHLVAPCSPTEFATRHVLESLLAAPLMASGATVVDVGSGAGLPIIPCLIVRPDITATLFESSHKKTVFLRTAACYVGLRTRTEIKAVRFESVPPPTADHVTCRALDRFTALFPGLLRWSSSINSMLLFGGDGLLDRIKALGLDHRAILIPGSERRYLFVVEPPAERKT